MPANLVGKHGVLHGFGARAKALGKGIRDVVCQRKAKASGKQALGVSCRARMGKSFEPMGL